MIYRPPPGSKYGGSHNAFIEEFHQYMDSRISTTGKILIVGDFNIHVEKKTPESTAFNDMLCSVDLNQHVKEQTHRHGHTLDLVLTRSEELMPQGLCVEPPSFSDHSPITFSIEMQKFVPETKSVSIRKIKDIDLEMFKEEIKNSELVQNPATDVQSAVKQYHTVLTGIMDRHAPVIQKEMVVRNSCPWFNTTIDEAKRDRRRAERRWCANKLEINLEILRDARRKVNALCDEAKCTYYQKYIKENSDNAKKLFKMTDDLLNKKKVPQLPSHESEEALANDMANYFVDKVKKITDKFPQYDTVRSDQIDSTIPRLTKFELVTETELKKIISSGNSKSSDLDPIPTILLKECLDVLLPTLTRIINLSLSSSTVPQDLKEARITPLIKGAEMDPEDMKSYRPVSRLSYLSKLLEKAAVDQLDDYLVKNGLNEVHQSAYRKYHSTETALLKICDDLLCAMDRSECSVLVMLDQSAAFDTINQDMLLDRMKHSYGITDSALKWLHSYFKGRTQAVFIGSKSSDTKQLVTGFPQGSVLGPFSYPVYTSPLLKLTRSLNVPSHMFADDTQMYNSFKPKKKESSINKIQGCLEGTKEWMYGNHLKLNDNKTKILVIGNPRMVKQSDINTIKIGDENIAPIDSAKNIGVTLDSNLSMRDQINSVCRQCYIHLRHISQIRKYLTEEAAATLARSLILSKLDYGNGLLYGLPDCALDKLQRIQNHAAKVVMRKKKHDHVTPLLKHLHWLPVKQRINFKICLLTYKILDGKAPQYLKDLIQVYEPDKTLRSVSKSLLVEKRTRLKGSGDRAFSACAPKLWNQLPVEVKTCSSIESFKKALKTYYFKKVFT